MAPNVVSTPEGLCSAIGRDGDWYTIQKLDGTTMRMHRDRYFVARAAGIVAYAEATGQYVVERPPVTPDEPA